MLVCLLDRIFFLLGGAAVYLSQPLEPEAGEQAMQHCQLNAGDSNKEEQAQRHVHPRTATVRSCGCDSFPSLSSPSRQMH